MYNFFTKKSVPQVMVDLKYDQDVILRPDDMIYYAYMFFDQIPYSTRPRKMKDFAYISPSVINNSGLVSTEVDFLKHFGLVFSDPSGGAYVSPLAMIFYRGENDALFALDLGLRLSTLSSADREVFFRPLLNLLTEFTLPGRREWMWHALGVLPDSIHLTQRYEQEDIDIVSILEKIRNEY